MSNVMRTILGAGAVMSLALSVQAAQVSGTPALIDCTDLVASDTEQGEAYVIKVAAAAGAGNFSEDILWDLENKTEGRIGGTSVSNGGYVVDDEWAVPQLPSDIHCAIVTYPRSAPNQGDRIVVDTGTAGEFSFGATIIQTVGNSIPATLPRSVGLTIPGDASQFPVDFDGPGGPARGDFPVGTTSNAIVIAFAPVAEINDLASDSPINDRSCTVGGRNANPNDPASTNPTPTIGCIIGYNVYRIPSTGANTGSPAEFMAAISDADPNTGWVGFVDLRTFRFQTADTTTPGPAPSELNHLADIAGLQNVDGRMYSGDEVILFQDSLRDLNGNPRANAPDVAQDYWFTVQPVVQGRVSDFANVSFTNNAILTGNHTLDLDNDGTADSVSLDTLAPHNTPEFISPQADVGLDGLGLTVEGRPLLSAPMFFESANPLPAGGQVRLSGTASGNDVTLQITTGLESGAIQGYNVLRAVDSQRVNDQLILAQGSESNVYQVMDDAASARRLARGGKVQYMVEIVYTDGTPTQTVGPFDVTFDQGAPTRRRR